MAVSRVFQVHTDAREDDGSYTRRIDVEQQGENTLLTVHRLDALLNEEHQETLALLAYDETYELAYTLLYAAGEITLDQLETKLRDLQQMPARGQQ